MTQFSGYVCDSCERVIASRDRVKKTVKYDGRAIGGETTFDLCGDCSRTEIEEQAITLRPLRRRRIRDEADAVEVVEPRNPTYREDRLLESD